MRLLQVMGTDMGQYYGAINGQYVTYESLYNQH